MSHSKVIYTPDLLKGLSFKLTSTPFKPEKIPVNEATIGEFVLTKPSNFKLTTKAFGGLRKKEEVIQIYLHHTAGSQRADKGKGTVHTFNSRAINKNHGSTHAVIDKNGHLEELIPWEYKAYGQGVTGAYAKYGFDYNRVGMSIEIMALGYFNEKSPDGKRWVRGDISVPLNEGAPGVDFDLKEIKYKSHPAYHKYTDAQIKGTIEWTRKWMDFFKIKWEFNEETYKEMFPKQGTLSKSATGQNGLDKRQGVYSHNSVSTGKSDVFPQKELIIALKEAFGPGNTKREELTNLTGTTSTYLQSTSQ